MADEPTTYIKLDRKILVWEWYHSTTVKSLFIHLLLIASHEEKHYMGVYLKRGQCLTTLKALSEGSGLSVQQIRTAIAKLRETGEITVATSPSGTVITVSNYEKYQGRRKSTNQQHATNKPATNPIHTNSNVVSGNKKEKNEKNESPPGDEEPRWIFQ